MADLIGQRIGDYQIIGILGKGGMGGNIDKSVNAFLGKYDK
ncbi:MAG TPA: hypothetical protein PLD47_05285 [Aggregatilineales bacterium]|nr:hypothetical protein [Aggregatilineales bacterium]